MENEIQKFLKEHYDLAGELKKLNGYEDVNFKLTMADGRRFVVKLTANLDAFEFLEAQNIVFERLGTANDIRSPEIISSKDGNRINRFISSGNNIFYFRVLSFVEGKFLAEADITNPVLYNFGKFLGMLDRQLFDLNLPAVKCRREEWDLKYFLENEKYIHHIRDKSKHRFVEYAMLQFRQEVLPRMSQLKHGIIHNDGNDWNILIDDSQNWGLIDFGDMAFAPIINEIAIAGTYMAMDTNDPVGRISEIVKGYHSIFPLASIDLEVLYYLIAARLATSVCQSAYAIRNNPENTYINVHERKAWDLLEKWLSISPEYVFMQLAEACDMPVQVDQDNMYRSWRDRHISKALSLSYRSPIHMLRGTFQYMFDQQGKTYVDLVNNIMHVGHCHPKIVDAAHRQMAMLNTNTRYLYKSINEYADELLKKFPSQLNKVFFVNSGSAASDLALRMARNYTGRKDMVVMEHGYHGNTAAAIEVSPYKFNGKGGNGPEPHIHIAPIPDSYHSPFDEDDPAIAKHFASKIDPYLDKNLAGFICESIVGCGGQVMLPPGYLTEVYRKIRKTGGVCIADEVQTGFGRMGSHFWAYETQGVIPDIVILGKPMGNGHPLAAVVTTDEIAGAFENGMEFFSSFGGNPVSCEIGLAVLRVIEDEALMDNAYEVGKFLLNGFNTLRAKHELVGHGRGMGLFLGIELIKDNDPGKPATEESGKIINLMKEKGFLLSTDGPFNNVLKIKPPMCLNIKNAHDLLENLDATLQQIHG